MKKSIKKTLIIWVLIISIASMVTGYFFSKSLTNEKLKTDSILKIESYYASIIDRVDAELEGYVAQLTQLNCYRINPDWNSEEISNCLRLKSNNRPNKFDYLAYLDINGDFITDLEGGGES